MLNFHFHCSDVELVISSAPHHCSATYLKSIPTAKRKKNSSEQWTVKLQQLWYMLYLALKKAHFCFHCLQCGIHSSWTNLCGHEEIRHNLTKTTVQAAHGSLVVSATVLVAAPRSFPKRPKQPGNNLEFKLGQIITTKSIQIHHAA